MHKFLCRAEPTVLILLLKIIRILTIKRSFISARELWGTISELGGKREENAGVNQSREILVEGRILFDVGRRFQQGSAAVGGSK